MKIKRSQRMFTTLLLSYIVVFLVPSICGVLMYAEVEKSVKSSLFEYNISFLKQIGNVMDSYQQELTMMTDQVSITPIIKALANEESVTANGDNLKIYNDIIRIAENYAAGRDYIADAYLYIPQTDSIISTTAIVKPEIYFNKIRKYVDYDYSTWRKEFFAGANAYRFFKATSVQDYPVNRNIITFSHSYLKSSSSEVVAYFNVLIDADKIISSVKNSSLLENGEILFFDANNNIIFYSGQSMVDMDTLAERCSSDSGSFEQDSNVIFYVSSKINKWKYVIVAEDIPFLNSMLKFRKNLALILAFSFLIGAATVIWFARQNYRPIKDVVETIKNKKLPYLSTTDRKENEMDMIKNVFSQQYKNELIMNNTIFRQRQIIKNDLLRKLVRGELTMEMISDTTKGMLISMNVDFPEEMFGVAVIAIAGGDVLDSEKTEAEDHLAKYAVSNIAAERLGEKYHMNIVDMGMNKLALLVNLSAVNSKNWFEDVVNEGNSLAEVMQDEFGLAVYVGAGNIYQKTIGIKESYAEALSALNFKVSENAASVICYKDMSQEDKDIQYYYYYPIDIEGKIINAYLCGDYTYIEDALDDIIHTNVDSLHIDGVLKKSLNYNLVGTYWKACKSAKEAATNVKPFAEVDFSRDPRNLAAELKELYRAQCHNFMQNKSDHSEKMIENIRMFVENNFGNSCLDARMIADRFGITPQYLSSFFRKNTGEKLADYIAKVRVEAVKRFLADKSLTLNEIADMVGYSNDIGLIRLFKKYEGVTPGIYRDRI